jgi:uncharacterized protein
MSSNSISFISKQVSSAMSGFEPGHDFSHVRRVVRHAMTIQKTEGGNSEVIHLAALLHEMCDSKFFDSAESLQMVTQWLSEAKVSASISGQVISIVTQLGFSKELNGNQSHFIEFDIVQDADRLEALGLIGAVRAFSYGASKKRPFFDAEIWPVKHLSAQSYAASQTPTINHFFEKLFLLKDKMRTPTGRQLAIERHRRLWQFLCDFFEEYGFENAELERRWMELLNDFSV